MQYKTFHIVSLHESFKEEDDCVSFKKFSEFLHEKLHQSDTLRAKYYRFVLKHFRKNPELLSPINIHSLEKYKYLFDLLEGIILPDLANEKELALGLSTPMSGRFFFSTEAFQNLMKEKSENEFLESEEDKKLFLQRRNKAHYILVLERFYNFKLFIKEEVIHVETNARTHLTRYFNIDVDNRFVGVTHKGKLPKIDMRLVQQYLANTLPVREMEKMLPLSRFSFSGFSIVTATDITPRYALHKMRSAIIRHNPGDYDDTYKTIIALLKQLCGRQDITFGLLPFLKLNDRLVSYYGNYVHSIMIDIATKLKIPESTFLEWINMYFKNPQTIIKKGCDDQNKNLNELDKGFSKMGFNGYALIPVFYNNEVAGMLEASAKDQDLLDENLFTRIDSAIPILGQLMHQSQTEFAANITNVIRTHFTAIQPSVVWKFNEVAWSYIKNSGNDSMNKMEEIRFENVYPLYGAIDIRNSTIERNNALQKDMRHYFQIAINVLGELHTSDKKIINELKDEAKDLLAQLEISFTGNEGSLMDAFMSKLGTYLNNLKDDEGHNKNIIKKYFKDIDEKNGKAYARRRILENSMQFLNFIITDHLDKMHNDIQKKYPVYFEKIRTDGIEYDMYLGQSISPMQTFKKTYLNDLRLMQLKNMANITKLVHASAQALPIALQTTQLIYVNASSIDITFRMDEKRFDAEGGYNIRYHIVKKRIDKVHIAETGERLTQPGKLAIIYTQANHEKEYLRYIRELQHENILKQNIELLELEELQGVTGLKAIRVEVNMD